MYRLISELGDRLVPVPEPQHFHGLYDAVFIVFELVEEAGATPWGSSPLDGTTYNSVISSTRYCIQTIRSLLSRKVCMNAIKEVLSSIY